MRDSVQIGEGYRGAPYSPITTYGCSAQMPKVMQGLEVYNYRRQDQADQTLRNGVSLLSGSHANT